MIVTGFEDGYIMPSPNAHGFALFQRQLIKSALKVRMTDSMSLSSGTMSKAKSCSGRQKIEMPNKLERYASCMGVADTSKYIQGTFAETTVLSRAVTTGKRSGMKHAIH